MKGEVAVRGGWMLPLSHHDSLCWFHLGKQQRNWQSVPRYNRIYNCIYEAPKNNLQTCLNIQR